MYSFFLSLHRSIEEDDDILIPLAKLTPSLTIRRLISDLGVIS